MYFGKEDIYSQHDLSLLTLSLVIWIEIVFVSFIHCEFTFFFSFHTWLFEIKYYTENIYLYTISENICFTCLRENIYISYMKFFSMGALSPNLLICVLVIQLCSTLCDPLTIAHQAALSMGFSRQDYWSGLPFSPPGDLSNPKIEPGSPVSPILQTDSLLAEPSGKAPFIYIVNH